MKELHMVAFILVMVGAINLGLTVFGLNLVGVVTNMVPGLGNIFNLVVGASGVYIFATHMQDCKICSSKKK